MPTAHWARGAIAALIVLVLAASSACRTTSSKPEASLASASANKEAAWSMGDYKKPTEQDLKSRLTEEQFAVTQKEATEPPFRNAYWNNHEHGIYVDVVSGEPLFSSLDKFDSGTGWPSFTQPLAAENVAEHTDYKLILPRTEVRSKHADSHLGHVFEDGPEPTRMRYCINSAALRFVPVGKLAEEGYAQYVERFEKAGISTTPQPGSAAGTK